MPGLLSKEIYSDYDPSSDDASGALSLLDCLILWGDIVRVSSSIDNFSKDFEWAFCWSTAEVSEFTFLGSLISKYK